MNHKRYFSKESNRDINCAKADEIYSLKHKHQHRKDTVSVQFSSAQSLSRVRLFVTPGIAAHQASLSITNSQSSPKLMSIESAMPSSHLILCHPLLLLPPISARIRVFSNESTLRMRWPKYCSFSRNISPSNEHPGLQKRQFFCTQLSL